MAKNGRSLTPNKPTRASKQLVSDTAQRAARELPLSVSFQHFKQIDLFGVGNCPKEWHVGLLDRLNELNKLSAKSIIEDNRGSKSLRCHSIDWKSKGLPISRKDLNWLPKDILSNDKDFRIMQISISTSAGRIIGFFNRDQSVFYVVLLDPNHNMQPGIKHNNTVQPTTLGVSQYDDLLAKLQDASNKAKSCVHHKLQCKIDIDHIHQEHNIVYVALDNEFYAKYSDLLSTHSLQEVIKTGIDSIVITRPFPI